jgi:hypothetical protein
VVATGHSALRELRRSCGGRCSAASLAPLLRLIRPGDPCSGPAPAASGLSRAHSIGTCRVLGTTTREQRPLYSRSPEPRATSPGCQTKVIAIVEGEPFINVQIAHIRGAKRDGPRYEQSMTDDERRSWPNLLLLCKPHHELVDQRHPDRYSVEVLESWKTTREGESGVPPGALSTMTEGELAQLVEEAVRRAGPIREVRVELDLGIRVLGGMLRVPHATFTAWYMNNRDLGAPVLIVTVRNAGALDAFVNGISLISNPSGPSTLSMNDYPQFNPALPFKVTSGESREGMINLRQPIHPCACV